MKIERTENELVIRLPLTSNILQLEKYINYFKVMEILSKAQGTEEQGTTQKLAEEANEYWYEKNKSRFQ